MSDENRCPECGAPLPARAPHGLCPGCLLKKGIETVAPASEEACQTNADSTPPAPAELAAQFPDLEILEFIGRGGMGMVYKARQKHLDRLVALKILLPKIASDPAFAERFAREARAMAILSHPHIVTVHDFGQKGSLYYFLMEFVDGLTLRQLLDSGKLAPQEVLAIVPQICEALQYAHDKGVVHRDIKPENILMDRSGRVKIADFGLAKLVGQEASDFSLTGAGQIMGTPHYMAPEQLEHPQEVDHRADIYSLGVVFYQMLTGELPIGRFAPPSKKVQIDVRLDEVVLRALEKEPELRFQQASDVKTQVEAITNGPVGSKANNRAWQSPNSAWGHFVGYLFGITFTSRLAYIAANFSALGFVAFLAFLSYLPFPGSDRLQAFSGFSGFFGLIGVAFIIEFVARRNVKAAAANARTGTLAAIANDTSRFSRLAIAGAAWAPLFFAMVILAFYASGPTRVPAGSKPPGPEWWQWALIFTVLPLGLIAPFGTTLLGWIAAAHIRRSAGRVYGLGLALFDGLFFPLLAMDIAIAYALFNFGIGFLGWSRNYDDAHNSQLIVLTCFFSLVADFLVSRWAWRAANKPMADGPQADLTSRRGGNQVFLDFAFGSMIAGILGMTAVIHYWPRHDGAERRMSISDANEPAAETGLQSPVGKVSHSAAEVLAELPAEARPDPSKGWDEFREPRANKWLDENISHKNLEVVLKAVVTGVRVRRISPKEQLNDTVGWDVEFVLAETRFELDGRKLTLRLYCFTPTSFEAGNDSLDLGPSSVSISGDEAFARRAKALRAGDNVTIRGTIRKASVSHEQPLKLWIFLKYPAVVTMPTESELMNAPIVAPIPATSQKLSFGPVIERVVNHSEAIGFNSDRNVALLGDAKRDMTKESNLTVVAWMLREHLDAFYTTHGGLAGIFMELKPLSNDDWDRLTPSQLKQAFAGNTIITLSKRTISQGATVPLTQAFKTCEDSVGILQIVGYTDNPPGVKIRYKLVQDSAIPARPTTRTRMLGRILTGKAYKEFSDVPGEARLIGFQVGLGEFFGKPVISSLQPIYNTLRGEVTGFQFGKADGGHAVIKAKDGYAIGGITVCEGLGIDGFSATFMRIRGDVLDPADSYASDWVGSKNGGSETRLAGTGAPVVGIFGRLNPQQTLGGLGLVLDGTVPEGGRK